MKISKKAVDFEPFDITIETSEECRALMEILATAKEWRAARLESEFANKLYPMIHGERVPDDVEEEASPAPRFRAQLMAANDKTGCWMYLSEMSDVDIDNLCDESGGTYETTFKGGINGVSDRFKLRYVKVVNK
jgi:hypothetical protein